MLGKEIEQSVNNTFCSQSNSTQEIVDCLRNRLWEVQTGPSTPNQPTHLTPFPSPQIRTKCNSAIPSPLQPLPPTSTIKIRNSANFSLHPKTAEHRRNHLQPPAHTHTHARVELADHRRKKSTIRGVFWNVASHAEGVPMVCVGSTHELSLSWQAGSGLTVCMDVLPKRGRPTRRDLLIVQKDEVLENGLLSTFTASSPFIFMIRIGSQKKQPPCTSIFFLLHQNEKDS